MLTRTSPSMIEASGEPGTALVSDGNELQLKSQEQATGSGAITEAFFDQQTGTLHLKNSDGSILQVGGFMTQGEIGIGQRGEQGTKGSNGTDGLLGRDGDKGSTGCQGPDGAIGREGPTGPQGLRGEQGPRGEDGLKGDKGDAGKVEIYITAEDPGSEALEGALWVRPGV